MSNNLKMAASAAFSPEKLQFLEKTQANNARAVNKLPDMQNRLTATPMTTSGGVQWSTDPVEQARQKKEVWDITFDEPRLTPEAKIASQGNSAINQWGTMGGVEGIDPTKLMDFNEKRRVAMLPAGGARMTNDAGVAAGLPSIADAVQQSQAENPAKIAAIEAKYGSPKPDASKPDASNITSVDQLPKSAWMEAPNALATITPQRASQTSGKVMKGAPRGSTGKPPLKSTEGPGFFDMIKGLLGSIPAFDASKGGWQDQTTAERAAEWEQNPYPNVPVRSGPQTVLQEGPFLPRRNIFGKELPYGPLLPTDLERAMANLFGSGPLNPPKAAR